MQRITEIAELNERSRTVLRQIVETYLSTGEPVGSRNLSRVLPMTLSPASIRNVMSDLEHLGLIVSPHTSAGRLPTQSGLRLFVDGLLEVGDLNAEERRAIEGQLSIRHQGNFDQVLHEASEMISGLSHCAGVVLADKQTIRLKHIEFVPLDPRKALVILVDEGGRVENRIIELPPGLPSSALSEAANYLNAHVMGKTISEAQLLIEHELTTARAQLDKLTQRVIKAGLAEWSGAHDDRQSLIVRGQSNLLKDVSAEEDLERIRQLFDDLEAKRELLQLLGLAETAEGVKIFIGSENKLFSLSGSSLVVAPFHDEQRRIVGVIGIIGPTRLNYARIIPMVDYTAKLVSRLLT
ncbi:Heat-inducible transcription repressor HrcA [Candidatus Filomicrobium marinum]|uniref:Heat-inducible transcription repressor HrcA n=2 Tax=Filomicrobium TaxID=119044 RepID=A0A0D6JBN1_9HYPH|nr:MULTISPECIES: heat-inducible transcriptional repressor HrcA [Filomicrobium]MCV0370662.1 heat-inducible transcriptional repressor HrcA [Filomicrobium sp.]CFX07082.1 Heat-inducible transcription repressor HrcA [Candidatus Filomicrobium marinum]CPR16545.1 Heat-inducible transcription repressor HrcA [Candidatus Filomicrobium marinum]SDP57616.1 heat-inducible transcription repressor HrcA [Filomicrobium insigne]